MSFYTFRCTHCEQRYEYGGNSNSNNDSNYCPTCKAVILKALKNIPKAVEQFEIDASQEETEAILEKLKARQEAWDKEGAVIRPRLTKIPLLDMGCGYDTDIEVVKHVGVEFHVHTRSDETIPPKVFKQMERDLTTGKESPWYRCPLG